MAIIFSYPTISASDLHASDRFILSQMNQTGNPTKSVTLSDLAKFITSTGTGGTGSGKTDNITVWKTDDTIYSVTNDTAIANKDFNVIAKQSTANIKLGATDSTYTSINEGIEIYPNTTHYTTRVTPWLEVYSYEDPSLQPDNTYDANYDGSAFLMGKSNTVGSANSSNLAVIGFNNKIKGDKFVIIGQGNEMDLDANTASLAVGTTNDVLSGGLVNSLLVGQNIDVNAKVTRGILSGINHSFVQDSNNCLVTGSGNAVYGNNNFIWGASHQGLSGVNNIMQGGFSTQITNGNGNLYGSVLVGWNNTLSYASKASLIIGRDNEVARCDYSIVGGFNNEVGNGGTQYEGTFVVGNNNQVNGSGHIVGGDGNVVSQSKSIVSGTSNTVVSSDNLVVGTSNTVRIDECIVGGNNNTIGDTNDLGDARILAMGQSNVASNTSNTLLLGSGNTIGNNIGAPTNVTNAATFGQNNNLATAGNAPDNNFLLFSMGRANEISGTLAFAFGGGNTVRSNTNGNCIAIGNNNEIGWVTSTTSARNSIVIGTQNTLIDTTPNSGYSDYKILIGRGLDDILTDGDDYVLIGRNNDENNDYTLLNENCSLIVGASTMGAVSDRRNALVVTNKTAAGNESNVILPGVGKYRNYADDTAAAAGGVPLYGLYHNAGVVRIRIV